MSEDITRSLGQAVRECGTPPCFMSFELGKDECVCVCSIEGEPAANPPGKGRRRPSSRFMRFPRKRKGQSWQEYHDQLSGLAAKSLKEGKEAESFGYQVAAKMVAKRHHDDVMAPRKPGYRAAGPGTLSWNDCMEGLRRQHPTWSDDRCRKVCGAIRQKSKRMYPAYWGTAKRNPSKDEHQKIGDAALAEGMMSLYVALEFGGYPKTELASEMPDWMVRQVQFDIEDGQQLAEREDDVRDARLRLAIVKCAIAIVQISAAENSLKMVSPKKPSKAQQAAAKSLARACNLMRNLAARTSTSGGDSASINPSAEQHEKNTERIGWFIGDLVDRAFGGKMPDPVEGIQKVDSYIAYLCLAGALVANDVDVIDDDTFIPAFVLRPPAENVFRRSMATPSSYLHATVSKKKAPKQWNPAARGDMSLGGGHRPRAVGNQPRYRCTILDKAGRQKSTWQGTFEECRGRCPGLVLEPINVSQMTCRSLRDGGMLYLQRIA